MPNGLIGQMFGSCVAQAGYNDAEQDSLFDLLESLAAVAKEVHSDN